MATWEDLVHSVSDQTKPLLVDFVNTLLQDAAAEVPAYAEEVADYLAEWLKVNAGASDETVKRNLAHVRIQIQNLAAKHALKVQHDTMALVEKVTTIMVSALVAALKVALA